MSQKFSNLGFVQSLLNSKKQSTKYFSLKTGLYSLAKKAIFEDRNFRVQHSLHIKLVIRRSTQADVRLVPKADKRWRGCIVRFCRNRELGADQ